MTDNFFGKTLAVHKIDSIPGLLEFDIPVHGDNRGWFKENFQKEKMLPLGFPESFFVEGKLQNNVSFSRKNVLRGLHAEPWDKYISVADGGKVLGSWVDLREGGTFGNVYQTEIDASKGIFVPRGVANGFKYSRIQFLIAIWSMTTGRLSSSLNMPLSTMQTQLWASSGKT